MQNANYTDIMWRTERLIKKEKEIALNFDMKK